LCRLIVLSLRAIWLSSCLSVYQSRPTAISRALENRISSSTGAPRPACASVSTSYWGALWAEDDLRPGLEPQVLDPLAHGPRGLPKHAHQAERLSWRCSTSDSPGRPYINRAPVEFPARNRVVRTWRQAPGATRPGGLSKASER